MGVRSYTPDMLTTQSPTTPWRKAAQVIVDWTDMKDEKADAELEVDHLMRWIHSYPQRAAVHVFLRRSRLGERDRRIQNTLLSLGCTVTMRSEVFAHRHAEAEKQTFASDRSFW